MKYLFYGTKIGMSQLIEESGDVVPVTLIRLSDSKLLTQNDETGKQLIAYVKKDIKKTTRPILGQFNKYNVEPHKILKETSFDSIDFLTESGDVNFEVFKIGSSVNVRSKSKGRGFSGTIKRHGFARGPMSHGSKNHRLPGSIGAGTYPGRVFKGTKMSGQYGNKNVTIRNLKLVVVDSERRLIGIKGGVPGGNGSLVEITG